MPTGKRANHSRSGFKLDRLVAFSDGVIAIAITILVLGLEVPSAHEVTPSELRPYLRETIQPALGFVTSFVLIGTYWLEHYAIFHFLTHATRPLVALNGLFLLSLSFLPFPTGLQAAYRNDELAMTLYCVAQLLCGLSLLAIWLYAVRGHRLVDPMISPKVVRSMTRRILMAPGLCLLAMGISLVSIWASRFVLLCIPVIFISHRVVDAHLQALRTDHTD